MTLERDGWKCLAISASAGLISSLFVIFVFYLFISDTNFMKGESCVAGAYYQFCYYGEGGVWDDASYLQTITSFYTAIITVLIAVIAMVGLVATLSIRAGVKAHAEQEMPSIVKAHFDRQDTSDDMRAIVYSVIKASLENGSLSMSVPKDGELGEAIRAIEIRLETVEHDMEEVKNA